MLFSVGLIGTAAGVLMAGLSDRFPANVEELETLAGILLIGGLGLPGGQLLTIPHPILH